MPRKKKRELILTELEMARLEVADLKIKGSMLEKENVSIRQELIRSEIEVLALQVNIKKNEIARLSTVGQNINNRLENIKKDYSSYRDHLSTELNLVGKTWGYHPDSGEVIVDKV